MTTAVTEETAPAEAIATPAAPQTTTALALRPQMHTLPAKLQYAQELANSGLLPANFRRQPANVLFAIEYGEMLGLSPIAAMMGIYVIDGKPAAYASLISALVRKAGHKLRVGYDDTKRMGWAEIVRADDPGFTFRSEWDLNRAVTAELCTIKNGEPYATDSKGQSKPWRKFFPSMTKARAITEVARDACEEALFGLHYTPEELGAEVDEEGHVIGGTIVGDQQPAEDTWYVRPPGVSDPAAREWFDQAIGRADAADLTKDEAGQLWTDATARTKAGTLPADYSRQLKSILTRRLEEFKAAAAQAPGDGDVVDAEIVEDPAGPDPTSVPSAGTQDAEPASPGTAELDPADPWAANVESIACQEDADAALADASKQLEAGHLTQDKFDAIVLAISARLDTLSQGAAA